jgi:uncharacterized membrane protein YvbJ
MKCPKCGADNPESAEFCSLCMENLRQQVTGTKQRRTSAAPGDLYVAPGEWRGDAETLRPKVSKVVEAKVKKFRVKLMIYGALIAIIIIWLVLSFTVWGNPSPAKRSMQLFDAVNSRNEEAFVGLFEEKNADTAKRLYADIVSYLGESGRYENIKLEVEVANVYEAASFVESGNIVTGGGSTRSISSADNLMINLENHSGRWYIVPIGTSVIP